VAVALPNIPIRALKLGYRIPLNGVARGRFEGLRCARSFSDVVLLVRFGRVSEPGRRSKSLFWLSVGPSPRGLAHFMAAALPKVPMHALKLGDRISPTGVARGRATGYRYAHSSSDMAPPVRFGEVVQPGRFSAQSKHLSAKASGHFRYFCPPRIDPDS